jgi:TRAP-type C4-dicarboxylate transport system substrate-binding protein
LKLISGYPDNNISSTFAKPFADRVNKESHGAITIKIVGGPEIISSRDQANALKTGVVDLSLNTATVFAGSLPDISVISLSRLNYKEERASGFYDFLVERLKTINVRYLFRAQTPQHFYMSLNKMVKKPSDLAGLKMRTTATYDPFFKALGIVGVSMPNTDTYNAISMGVIQGYVLPIDSQYGMKLYEVTKYFIDYSIYESGNTALMMNLNSFARLPQNLQDLIVRVSAEMEDDVYNYFANLYSKFRAQSIDKGMKPIRFSDADAKTFLDLAYDSQWNALKTKMSADMLDRAKRLCNK